VRAAERKAQKLEYKKNFHECNFILKSKSFEVVKIIKACELPGCKRGFELEVSSRSNVYPRFCPEHRNEYKRWLFLYQRRIAA
jgi:hypothetical protein